MITLPTTASERLDLSFGIFARRGEKYSCYAGQEMTSWVSFIYIDDKGRLHILFQTTFLRRFILQTTRDTPAFQTTPHKVSA
ncbi:hypothetical protein [Neisseria sp. HMSC067H09]|jgi:hypothetical protein